MSPWIRRASPFAAAIVASLAVVLASNGGLAVGATYAFAGFLGGMLVVGGTLMASGVLVRDEVVEDFSGVEPEQSAAVAPQLVGEITTTHLHVKLTLIGGDGLEQNVLAPDRPTIGPAAGALRARPSFL